MRCLENGVPKGAPYSAERIAKARPGPYQLPPRPNAPPPS
jgi:hypothetical protein